MLEFLEQIVVTLGIVAAATADAVAALGAVIISIGDKGATLLTIAAGHGYSLTNAVPIPVIMNSRRVSTWTPVQ